MPRQAKEKPRVQIIVDTREQMPWSFDPKEFEVISRKLDFGDYACAVNETAFFIERKSLDDFVGSITAGRDRLWTEFERANASQARGMIMVEGSVQDVLTHSYQSATTTKSVIGTCAAIFRDFGYAVLFAGGRLESRIMAEAHLRLMAHHLEEQAALAIDGAPDVELSRNP